MKKLALVAAALALFLASACATTRAQTPPARQPLEVPPAPPRVIEPAPPQPPPQLEPVDDLPAPPATSPKPRPQPRDTTPRDAQKTEPKPETQPVEQPPVQTPAQPVPPLRTARTADGAQAERQIRDIINRANGLLGRLDYRVLRAERRKAYDQAKQFIEGAEGAIKDSKFEYALELADKAETLAKQLQGR